MLIELLGGPVDGMLLDKFLKGKPPRSFILPAVCLGVGYVYVSEIDGSEDFIQYRFCGYCSLR